MATTLEEAKAIILNKGAIKQLHHDELVERYGPYPRLEPKKKPLDFKDQSAVQAEAEARAGKGEYDIQGNKRVAVKKEATMTLSKFEVLMDLLKQGGGNFPVPEDTPESSAKQYKRAGGGMFPEPSSSYKPPAAGPAAAVAEKPTPEEQNAKLRAWGVKPDKPKDAPMEAGKPPKAGYKLQTVIVHRAGKQFKSHRWVREGEPDKVEHTEDKKPEKAPEKPKADWAGVPVPEKEKAPAPMAEVKPLAEKEKADLKEKFPIQHLWGEEKKPKAEKPMTEAPLPEPESAEEEGAAPEPPAGMKERTPKPAAEIAHLKDLTDKQLGQRLDWYEHRYYSAKDKGDEFAKKDALWRLIPAKAEAKKRGFNWKPMLKRGPGETGGLGAGPYKHGGEAVPPPEPPAKEKVAPAPAPEKQRVPEGHLAAEEGKTPKPAAMKEHLVDLNDKELGQRLDWYEHRYYSAKDKGDDKAKDAALWRLLAAQKEARKRGFAWKPGKERKPGETGGLGAGPYKHAGAPEPAPAAAPKMKPVWPPQGKPAAAAVAEKPGAGMKLADLDDNALIDRFKFYEDAYYKAKEAGNEDEKQAQVWKIVAAKKEMAKRGIQFKKSYDQDLWKAVDDVEKEMLVNELIFKACVEEGKPITKPFDIKKPSAGVVLKKWAFLAPLAAGAGGGAAAGGAAAGTAGAAGAGTAAAGAAGKGALSGALKQGAMQGAMSGAMGGGGGGGDNLQAAKDNILEELLKGLPSAAGVMPGMKNAAPAPAPTKPQGGGMSGGGMKQQFKSGLAQGAGQALGQKLAGGGDGQGLQASHDTSVPGVLLKKAAMLGLIKTQEAEDEDDLDDVKTRLLATVLRSYGTYLQSANEAKEANRQLDAAAALQAMYTEPT